MFTRKKYSNYKKNRYSNSNYKKNKSKKQMSYRGRTRGGVRL